MPVPHSDHYSYWFSSDALIGSGSYEASRVYRAEVNADFSMTASPVDANLPYDSILLVDSIQFNNVQYFLLIEHYLTDARRLILFRR